MKRLLIALFLLVGIGFPQAASGKNLPHLSSPDRLAALAAPDDALSPQQQKQIDALSAHLVLNDGFMDQFLTTVSFPIPNSLENSWKFYPDYRKVLVASSMAESAEPNRGADRFLAMLAYALARRGDPVSYEPSLARIKVSSFYKPASSISFGALPHGKRASEGLSPEHISAIKSLSKFLESGSMGTPQSIMVQYLGLTFDDAFTLLESSASTEHALRAALARLPEDRRAGALTALTTEASRINPALRYEDALLVLLPPNRRGPTDEDGPGPGFKPANPTGPNGGSPAGPAPSRTLSEAEVLDSYRELYERSYKTEKSRDFNSMKTNRDGFGGIILGNTVTRSALTPRILSVLFEQTTSDMGRFKVVLGNQTVAVLPNVSLGEARAAYQLVYSPSTPFDMWSPGKGIGLTGLAYDCRRGFTRVKLDQEKEDHLRVVLNPVLQNTRLGWSAIAADERAAFASAVAKGVKGRLGDDLTDEAKNDVYRLVFHTFYPLRHAGWKITDTELQMSIEHAQQFPRIQFTRSDAADQFPIGLRRVAYLEIKLEGKELPDSFPSQFYALFPLLMRAFPEYQQINHFASVLALVRLAKLDQAAFAEPHGPVKTIETPEYIVYKGTGIYADPTPLCRAMTADDANESMRKLLDQLKNNPKQ